MMTMFMSKAKRQQKKNEERKSALYALREASYKELLRLQQEKQALILKAADADEYMRQFHATEYDLLLQQEKVQRETIDKVNKELTDLQIIQSISDRNRMITQLSNIIKEEDIQRADFDNQFANAMAEHLQTTSQQLQDVAAQNSYAPQSPQENTEFTFMVHQARKQKLLADTAKETTPAPEVITA